MADLENMMTLLFTAPLHAVAEAEASHRATWAKWLQTIIQLIDAAGVPAEKQADFIAKQISMAPVMKLEAAVDLGVTMKVTSVKEKSGSAKLGLGVGAFSIGGSFSFMEQNTQESVLTARARYQLSNTNEQTLAEYLASAQLEVTDKAGIANAATKLGAPQ